MYNRRIGLMTDGLRRHHFHDNEAIVVVMKRWVTPLAQVMPAIIHHRRK